MSHFLIFLKFQFFLQHQSLQPIHFGLNDATLVNTISVTWPNTGVETYTNIDVNSTVKIVEGSGIQLVSNNTANKIPGCTDSNSCNYNPDAQVDDGSCIEKIEYCIDSDGDGLGNPNSNKLLCAEELQTSNEIWVLDCTDLEPNCSTNNSDFCGVCNGENECFAHPNAFIDTWILTELNEYVDNYCYDSGEGILSNEGPFNTNTIFNDINPDDYYYQFTSSDGSIVNQDCITYKIISNNLSDYLKSLVND